MKKAMEKGRTVIIINSDPIRTSFYDVFNRYFSIIADGVNVETKKQQYKYYANVSVGSHARSCVVHPDFKVIVHLPKSSLKTTPLPFLNRFEKYLVSVEDALRDQIMKHQFQPISGLQVAPGQYGTIFDAISHSLNKFVSYFHDQQGADRLLCGVLEKETVASLVLAIVERTVKMEKKSPQIPPPFRKNLTITSQKPTNNNNGKEEDRMEIEKGFEKMEVDTDSSSTQTTITDSSFDNGLSDISAEQAIFHTKEYVAEATKHLLQTARPEALYFAQSKMPNDYVSDYISNQSHFDGVSFIHSLCQRYFSILSNEQTDQSFNRNLPLRKWVMYTRTSGHLLRLHTDAPLRESLQQSNEWKVHVLSFAQFQSISECDAEVKHFKKEFEGKKALLLCTVDMKLATSTQLNHFRTVVDSSLSDKLHMVLIVAHISPELSLLRESKQHTLFLNQWDFIYIDFFSKMTTSTNEKIVAPGSIVSGGGGQSEDDSVWISNAFHVKTSNPENSITSNELENDHQPDALVKYFSNLFDEYCSEFLFENQSKLQRPEQNIKEVKNLEASSFYRSSTPQKRYGIILKLFDKHKSLKKTLVERYSTRWQSSLSEKVTVDSFKQVLAGNVLGSIVLVLQDSMKLILKSLVREFMLQLILSYTLETVFQFEEDSKNDDRSSLLKLIMQLIPIPNHVDMLALHSTPPSFSLHMGPSLFPFYEMLCDRLKKTMSEAIHNLSMTHRNPKSLLEELKRTLTKTDPTLMKVIDEVIEVQPPLKQKFLTDFARRTILAFHTKSAEIVKVCCNILRHFVFNHFQNDHILCYFVLRSDPSFDINYVAVCLKPLDFLQPPVSDINIDPRDLANTDSSEEKVALLSKIALQCLFNRLETISDADELENWCQSFARFNTHFDLTSLQKIGNSERMNFDLCSVLFKCVSELSNNDFGKGFELFQKFKEQIKKHSLSDQQGRLMSSLFFLNRWEISNPQIQNSVGLIVRKLIYEIFVECPPYNSIIDVQTLLNLRSMPTFVRLEKLSGSEKLGSQITTKLISEALESIEDEFISSCIEGWIDSKQERLQHVLMQIGQLTYEKVVFPYKYVVDVRPSCRKTIKRSLEQLGFDLAFQFHTKQGGDFKYYCDLYERMMPTGFLSNEQQIALTLERTSIAVLVLESFSAFIIQSSDKLVDNFSEISPKHRNILAGILTEQPGSCSPSNPKIYLLSLIPTTQLHSILKSIDVLKQLYLEEFLVDDESNRSVLFSFMFDNSTQMGKRFKDLELAVQTGNEKKIIELISNRQFQFEWRMFIILISFYKFFDKNQECKIIKKLLPNDLQKHLSLTPTELSYFNFLASKPPEVIDEDSILEWHFSSNVRSNRDGSVDARISYTMVNMLAIAVGMPSSGNHMYSLIFEPSISVPGKFGPGATAWQLYDCYYQVDERGQLHGADRQVLGNVRCRRMLINSTVWLAMSWPLLVHPVTTTQTFLPIHLINHIGDVLPPKKQRVRKMEESVQWYIFIRGLKFFEYLESDKDIADRRFEGYTYFRECLFKLWSLNQTNPTDFGCAKGFATTDAVLKYEGYWSSSIFDSMDKQYHDLGKVLKELLEKTNPKLIEINKWHELHQKFLTRPRLSLQQIGDMLSKSIQERINTNQKEQQQKQKQKQKQKVNEGKQEINNSPKQRQPQHDEDELMEDAAAPIPEDEFLKNLKLLDRFLQHRRKASALKHIPIIVLFSQRITSLFAYRVSREEAQSKSIPELIEMLGEHEERQVVDEFKRLWESFRAAWKALSSEIPVLPENCRNEIVNNELELPGI